MRRFLIFASAMLLAANVAFAQQVVSGGNPFFDSTLPGGYKAGRFYGPFHTSTPSNTALAAANTLYAFPFFVPNTAVLKTLSFDIGTGNASAWNARMCIYTDSGSGSPASLVSSGDTGTIAIGSGSVTGVQTSSTLNSGNGITLGGSTWYWIAFMADSNSESVFSLSGGGLGANHIFGDSIAVGPYNGVANWGYSMSQTFGACPGSMSSATIARNTAIPFVEAGF